MICSFQGDRNGLLSFDYTVGGLVEPHRDGHCKGNRQSCMTILMWLSRAHNGYVKVVGKAQATKSNSHNFRYRCLVVALIDVSEVLSQTLHACMSYERKKNLNIV